MGLSFSTMDSCGRVFKKRSFAVLSHSNFTLSHSHVECYAKYTSHTWHLLSNSPPSHFVVSQESPKPQSPSAPAAVRHPPPPMLCPPLSIPALCGGLHTHSPGVNIYPSAKEKSRHGFLSSPTLGSLPPSYSPDPPLTACHDRPPQYEPVFFVPPLPRPQSVRPSLPS